MFRRAILIATTTAHCAARRCKAIASGFGRICGHFTVVCCLLRIAVSEDLILLQVVLVCCTNDIVLHAD